MRAVALLLLAVAVHAELRAKALRRQGRSASCSCDCCAVAQRRPDERHNEIGLKCAPAEGHSQEVCGAQCQTNPHDKVLGLLARDQVVDTSRFCFYECKPPSLASALSSQCLALEDEQLKQVLDMDGNVMDPAFLYETSQPVALVASSNDGDEEEDVDPKAAKKEALKAISSLKKVLPNATEDIADVSDSEVATEIPDVEGSDPLLAAGHARDAAWRAEDSASKAAREAQKSVEALKIGRNETWLNAMWQADKAVNFMKRNNFRLATAHVHGPKPWRVQAAQAARAAAKPYLEANAHAAETLPSLDRQASVQESNAAKALRAKADELKTKAAVLRRLGEDTSAQLAEQFAAQTAQQAAAKEQAAKDWLSAAHSSEQKAKDERYLENAQVAADQAAAQLKLPQRYQLALPPDPLRHWVPTAPYPLP
mmetsp:Transcript_60009/g.140237  ORF Transcript_60009/g.140237 Transcript_60009/m.140237 type:complete len:425 (-) Transcript_60009:38-1312(-)